MCIFFDRTLIDDLLHFFLFFYDSNSIFLVRRPLHVVVRLVLPQPVDVPAELPVPHVGVLLHHAGRRGKHVGNVTETKEHITYCRNVVSL